MQSTDFAAIVDPRLTRRARFVSGGGVNPWQFVNSADRPAGALNDAAGTATGSPGSAGAPGAAPGAAPAAADPLGSAPQASNYAGSTLGQIGSALAGLAAPGLGLGVTGALSMADAYNTSQALQSQGYPGLGPMAGLEGMMAGLTSLGGLAPGISNALGLSSVNDQALADITANTQGPPDPWSTTQEIDAAVAEGQAAAAANAGQEAAAAEGGVSASGSASGGAGAGAAGSGSASAEGGVGASGSASGEAGAGAEGSGSADGGGSGDGGGEGGGEGGGDGENKGGPIRKRKARGGATDGTDYDFHSLVTPAAPVLDALRWHYAKGGHVPKKGLNLTIVLPSPPGALNAAIGRAEGGRVGFGTGGFNFDNWSAPAGGLPSGTAGYADAYLQANPDVQSYYTANQSSLPSGMTPEQFALQQWYQYGANEGRGWGSDPGGATNLTASEQAYLNNNPDVAAYYAQNQSSLNGATPDQFALQQYALYGANEGRGFGADLSGGPLPTQPPWPTNPNHPTPTPTPTPAPTPAPASAGPPAYTVPGPYNYWQSANNAQAIAAMLDPIFGSAAGNGANIALGSVNQLANTPGYNPGANTNYGQGALNAAQAWQPGPSPHGNMGPTYMAARGGWRR